MEGGDRLGRRRSLKERLGLAAACCGSTWDVTTINHGDDGEESYVAVEPDCVFPSPHRMNLAAALAAERHSVEAQPLTPVQNTTPTPPAARVSLMRLLEETNDQDERADADLVCCVCMGSKKGAAFIPCGHTFCRVCSRELWLNRGSCPLCNRSIIEILDIF